MAPARISSGVVMTGEKLPGSGGVIVSSPLTTSHMTRDQIPDGASIHRRTWGG